MLFPAGSRLTYEAQYGYGLLSGGISPADLVARIRQPLETNWGIVVEEAHGDPRAAPPSIVQLKVRVQVDYGNSTDGTNDVRLNIDHEIYQAGVGEITASKVLSYQLAGQKEQTTAAPGSQIPAGGTSDCGFFSKLFGLGGCSFELSTTSIIGIAILSMILLVVGLVAFAPGVTAAAAAAARKG